ncbi:hypothetical protein [Nocardioides insulae]|uniref:hypothetical protein n=1 Tax=Nocardioides insulae TaxID=394734 RepID=UPI000427DCCE|nr:hypothetical protein [Nocardioides insulae]
MLHPSAARRLAPLVLVGALLLTTAACDDSEPTSSPEPAASSTASSPSSSPTPSVQPAAGPVIDSRALTVRLPRGWRKSTIVPTLNQSGTDPATRDRLSVGFPPYWGDPEPLPKQTRTATRRLKKVPSYTGGMRVLDPVTVAGVPMYHITFRGDPGLDVYDGEEYGAQLPNGQMVMFLFYWTKDATSEAEREQLRQSIFATIRWKGFTP